VESSRFCGHCCWWVRMVCMTCNMILPFCASQCAGVFDSAFVWRMIVPTLYTHNDRSFEGRECRTKTVRCPWTKLNSGLTLACERTLVARSISLWTRQQESLTLVFPPPFSHSCALAKFRICVCIIYISKLVSPWLGRSGGGMQSRVDARVVEAVYIRAVLPMSFVLRT